MGLLTASIVEMTGWRSATLIVVGTTALAIPVLSPNGRLTWRWPLTVQKTRIRIHLP